MIASERALASCAFTEGWIEIPPSAVMDPVLRRRRWECGETAAGTVCAGDGQDLGAREDSEELAAGAVERTGYVALFIMAGEGVLQRVNHLLSQPAVLCLQLTALDGERRLALRRQCRRWWQGRVRR